MRSIHTNTNSTKQSGFTIVELLIVIVVIAILAAITIVSYNGITSRANSTSAQAAANIVIKKAEAYNADTSSYPTYPKQLVDAASDKVYALGTAATFTATAITTAPASPSQLRFYTCGTAAGVRVDYWKYDAGTPVWTSMTAGDCSGTNTFKASTATS